MPPISIILPKSVLALEDSISQITKFNFYPFCFFADCDGSFKNKHASKQVAKFNLLNILIFSKVKPIYLIDDRIVQLSQETCFENLLIHCPQS